MSEPSDPNRGARDLARVVTWSAALSMAITAAIVASIRQVNPTVEFKFSIFTVIAFFLVGFFTVAIFRRIFDMNAASPRVNRRRLALFAGTVAAALVASMAFALRGISSEKRFDVAAGIGIAVLVLSFGAWIGW